MQSAASFLLTETQILNGRKVSSPSLPSSSHTLLSSPLLSPPLQHFSHFPPTLVCLVGHFGSADSLLALEDLKHPIQQFLAKFEESR